VAADVVMAADCGHVARWDDSAGFAKHWLATNLADGALVAWKVPEAKIDAAFDFMFQCDPFSGHVVLRSTDALTAGSGYKLWTTVKGAARIFRSKNIADCSQARPARNVFRIMPAKRNFHSWSWPCPSQNNRARKPGRITSEDNRSARGRIERGASGKVLLALKRGVRAGRNSSPRRGPRGREGGWRFTGKNFIIAWRKS